MKPDSKPVHEPGQELELISKSQQEDMGAFNQLIEPYIPLLHSILLRMLNDEAKVQDEIGTTLICLWQNIKDFDPSRGKLIGWALTIARRRTIDRLRSDRSHSKGMAKYNALVYQEPHTSGYDLLEERDTAEHIRALLQKIPAAQRQCIEDAFFSGLSQRAIAKRTGVPLGTIKTRIELGLKKLRRALMEVDLNSTGS